jgi:hypothetical protein
MTAAAAAAARRASAHFESRQKKEKTNAMSA